MPRSIEQQIQTKLLHFVDDLTRLVRAQVATSVQDAVRQALAARRSPVGHHGNGKTYAGPRGPGTGQKRRPGEVDALAKRLLSEMRKKPGRRMEQVADAMRLPTSVLALPVQRLITAKKIRTTGTRRGTKYFAR